MITEKFGLDKVAHYVVGAWLCCMTTDMFVYNTWYGNNGQCQLDWLDVLIYTLVGVAAAVCVAIFKEKVIDKKGDNKDILATAIGAASMIPYYQFLWLVHTFTR